MRGSDQGPLKLASARWQSQVCISPDSRSGLGRASKRMKLGANANNSIPFVRFASPGDWR